MVNHSEQETAASRSADSGIWTPSPSRAQRRRLLLHTAADALTLVRRSERRAPPLPPGPELQVLGLRQIPAAFSDPAGDGVGPTISARAGLTPADFGSFLGRRCLSTGRSPPVELCRRLRSRTGVKGAFVVATISAWLLPDRRAPAVSAGKGAKPRETARASRHPPGDGDSQSGRAGNWPTATRIST